MRAGLQEISPGTGLGCSADGGGGGPAFLALRCTVSARREVGGGMLGMERAMRV